mmetsp:Transcript_32260/g.104209  ORF Transcript_32260/g.104209 Transcript_32260/m.104209 type:complete len:218 (-) Transcript_32260:165-818(-)
MPYHRSNSAIVQRRQRLLPVPKRRLQDAGREGDEVGGGGVVGVDCRGCHAPPQPVNGTVQVADILVHLERSRGPKPVEIAAIASGVEASVIGQEPPVIGDPIRVSDHVVERVHFARRNPRPRRVQPPEHRQAGFEGSLDPADHVQRRRARGRREELVHKYPAGGVAKVGVGAGHASLPPLGQVERARQHLVHFKRCLHVPIAQVPRVLLQHLQLQIG